jgi:tripartite-type tricarboxylate transporter receptor subunit TctC
MMAPANLAPEIVSRLNASVRKSVEAPDMKADFFRQGLEAETNTPEQFTAMIKREVDQNITLARAAGIKPQ